MCYSHGNCSSTTDKGFSAPVRRKTATAANGRRPSSSAKLTKIAHLEGECEIGWFLC